MITLLLPTGRPLKIRCLYHSNGSTGDVWRCEYLPAPHSIRPPYHGAVKTHPLTVKTTFVDLQSVQQSTCLMVEPSKSHKTSILLQETNGR